MSDDKPSIAELQQIEREDLAPAPWRSLEWWTEADRGKVAIRNAAPVLLEIAAAVKTLQAEGWDFRSATMDVLLAALARVRP